jgi:hypothetical protein
MNQTGAGKITASNVSGLLKKMNVKTTRKTTRGKILRLQNTVATRLCRCEKRTKRPGICVNTIVNKRGLKVGRYSCSRKHRGSKRTYYSPHLIKASTMKNLLETR